MMFISGAYHSHLEGSVYLQTTEVAESRHATFGRSVGPSSLFPQSSFLYVRGSWLHSHFDVYDASWLNIVYYPSEGKCCSSRMRFRGMTSVMSHHSSRGFSFHTGFLHSSLTPLLYNCREQQIKMNVMPYTKLWTQVGVSCCCCCSGIRQGVLRLSVPSSHTLKGSMMSPFPTARRRMMMRLLIIAESIYLSAVCRYGYHRPHLLMGSWRAALPSRPGPPALVSASWEPRRHRQLATLEITAIPLG